MSNPDDLTEAQYQALTQAKTWATASLVLGGVGLLLVLINGLGAIAGGFGVWLGYKAKAIFQVAPPQHSMVYGQGRSSLGIILSWLAVGLGALFFFITIVITGILDRF